MEKNACYAFPYQVGDAVFNPELAGAFKRIQCHGRSGFTAGETADQIVAKVSATGGIITHDDLKNCQADLGRSTAGSGDLSLISSGSPSVVKA